MGSQELAFDDEMSLDENAIAPSSFDESPSREIQKHLHALRFSANNQVLKKFNLFLFYTNNNKFFFIFINT